MDVPEKEAAIDRILKAVSSGISLKKACKVEKGINRPTFYDWMNKDDALADKYARARKQGWACMADELVDIIHNTEPQSEHVQLTKLEVDTKKWLLSKMLPKTYGDKQEVEHKGTAISVNVVKPDGAD